MHCFTKLPAERYSVKPEFLRCLCLEGLRQLPRFPGGHAGYNVLIRYAALGANSSNAVLMYVWCSHPALRV